jgi:hypothetical protein
MSDGSTTITDILSYIERTTGSTRDYTRSVLMVWQFIVVVAASIGFPTAALLFLIGGPRFPDEAEHTR